MDSNVGESWVFSKGALGLPPAQKVAVVACIDARLDPPRVLGLGEGGAYVIRNAGGVVTDDVIRSLVISQRLLGTTSIVLLHHSDCGMETFLGDELSARLEAETGIRPHFAMEAFTDATDDVRQSMKRLLASPFVITDHVRGFVYHVESGLSAR